MHTHIKDDGYLIQFKRNILVLKVTFICCVPLLTQAQETAYLRRPHQPCNSIDATSSKSHIVPCLQIAVIILVPTLVTQARNAVDTVLASERGQVQPQKRADLGFTAPRVGTICMIELSRVADAQATSHKHRRPRLFALCEMQHVPGLQILLAEEVVLHGLDFRIRADVKVEVEVAVVRTHPGEGEAEACLVRLDLVERRARHRREGRVVRFQMLQRRDMVSHQRARGTAGFGIGLEHEVVDDELGTAIEEVFERHLLRLAGRVVHGLEFICFGDFESRQRSPEFGQLVSLAGVGFLLLEEFKA